MAWAPVVLVRKLTEPSSPIATLWTMINSALSSTSARSWMAAVLLATTMQQGPVVPESYWIPAIRVVVESAGGITSCTTMSISEAICRSAPGCSQSFEVEEKLMLAQPVTPES